MKSYIPYMGSKSQVAEYLASLMPVQAMKTYIEPFVGGGSVYFEKSKAKVSILNDIDADVVNMHEAVACDPAAVMDQMNRLQISRRKYEQIREMRGGASWYNLTEAERAANMIYLLCCAFNANPRAPFPASSTVRLNLDPKKNLLPFAEHLRGSTFEHLHWSELLDRYVLKPKNLSCLIFADPPYVVATKVDHYRHRFDMIEHLLLARKLTQVNERNGGSRDVKVMITYDDDPEGYIRSLYRNEFGWYIHPLKIRYGGGNHSKETTELLITNYQKGENNE